MNRKRLTLLIVGFFISTAVVLFIDSGNKKPVTVSSYAKSEVGTKDDPFARTEYERRMLADPSTGLIPDNIRAKELKFAKNLPTVESVSLNKETAATWSKRGPINRGGRTRALGIDVRTQTAPNITILAAGVSGGIFKSVDNGATWVNKLSPDVIHSVTCLAQDTRPGQENTWYAGTGEALGNSAGGGYAGFYGDGIFKSVDNGETWALLPSTANGDVQNFSVFKFVNNISVNKATGSVFAAASNVIMRSQDGGASWNAVRSTLADNTMSDVRITSSGIIYAGIPEGFVNQDAGISWSADDGATWTDITPGGLTNYQRIVMAIAPSNENILYLWTFTGVGPTQTELLKYDASTTNWSNLTANLPPPGPGNAGINVQGSYDMVMKVKPDDPNFVVIGGTNIYRSTDGFSTPVASNSTAYIGGYDFPNHHPDQHSMVFLNPPNSDVFYSGNDGGVGKLDDVTQTTVNWIDLSRGYITSQFYAIAIDPNTAGDEVIAGGLQDNGNYITFSNDFTVDWIDWGGGGDGGYAAVRKTNPNEYTIYLESQTGNAFRLKFSSGFVTAFDSIYPPYTGQYAFINPFILDANNSDIMYFAKGDSVARSNDISQSTFNWTTMTNATTGSFIASLAVSKVPPNRLYVGGGNSEVLRIDGSDTGDPVPLNVSAGLPAGAYVSCIYVDPSNADNVIVVLSNYGIPSLWNSTNGGSNWTDISGNLEENPDGSGNGPSCRWASSVSGNGVTVYYVATSTGLYSTTSLNGNATVWAQEGPNTIGNVVCTMVEGRDADNYVVVSTHGAGVFSSNGVTSVNDSKNLRANYTLAQNYPNPFNPSTTISFSLPKAGKVKLTLFDALGSKVDEIANSEFSSGYHSVNYNASDLASGVYFYRIEAGSFVQSKKMILMK